MFRYLGVGLGIPAVMTVSAVAQSSDLAAVDLAPEGRQIQFSIEGKLTGIGDTDIESGGEYSVSRFGVGLGIDVPIADKSMLKFKIGLERSDYEFTDVFATPGGNDALDETQTIEGWVTYMTPFAEDKWTLLVGGGAMMSGDVDADEGESVLFSATAGAIWHRDANLSLGIGLMASEQFEEDVLIVPYPIIKYKINDEWMLASTGPKLEVTYNHSDTWDFGAYLALETRSFRLDTSANPASEGAVTEKSAHLGLFASYSPDSNFEIRGEVFSSAYSEWEIRDDSENELGDVKSDPGVGFGISAVFRF